MHATPFRLLGASALRAVETALARAGAAWAGEWGLPPALLSFSAERAWEAPLAKYTPAFSFSHSAHANGRGVWIAGGAELAGELQKALFGADGGHAAAAAAPASLAPAGARQAAEALLDALCRAALASQQRVARSLSGAGLDAPATVWQRGSGAVLVELAIGRQRCRLLLDGAAVQALQLPPASLAALAPVDYCAAVAATPVALQLTVGAAHVGLGSLMSLAAGDVIRLDRAVDAPVALSTLAGGTLFNAYLGRSGDSVAVELVSCQSPSYGAVK